MIAEGYINDGVVQRLTWENVKESTKNIFRNPFLPAF